MSEYSCIDNYGNYGKNSRLVTYLLIYENPNSHLFWSCAYDQELFMKYILPATTLCPGDNSTEQKKVPPGVITLITIMYWLVPNIIQSLLNIELYVLGLKILFDVLCVISL